MSTSRVLAAVFLACLGLTALAQEEVPKHLQIARDIVANVKPENNTYSNKPRYIRFPGDLFTSEYTVRTDCTGFVEAVLYKAFDMRPKFSAHYSTYYGGYSPVGWVDGIDKGETFDKIEHVQDMQPGDILIYKYIVKPDGPEYQYFEGHAMIVDAAPKRIEPQVMPKFEGTVQWEVRILDSSDGPMSFDDSRYVPTPGVTDIKEWKSKQRNGAGRGKVYIFTDADGNIKAESGGFPKSRVWMQDKERRVVMARVRYNEFKK